MNKYVCMICGFVYDEAKGIPDQGIVAGTTWESLPDDWICPLCGAPKSDFKLQAETNQVVKPITVNGTEEENLTELSNAQMSALCSNLAKGCEKQYLAEEAELFLQLADYYRQKAGVVKEKDFDALLVKMNENLEQGYPEANQNANVKPDRGALRALVWSEKVTRMLNSILVRYEKEKNSMLENTNIYVCEICGFIYIGDNPPEICPVCKVPNKKMTKVERG